MVEVVDQPAVEKEHGTMVVFLEEKEQADYSLGTL